jgi:hypothetical protein
MIVVFISEIDVETGFQEKLYYTYAAVFNSIRKCTAFSGALKVWVLLQ